MVFSLKVAQIAPLCACVAPTGRFVGGPGFMGARNGVADNVFYTANISVTRVSPVNYLQGAVVDVALAFNISCSWLTFF